MAVFDGVSYSLSPSLSPTRRTELSAILDLNGAAPHPPYTHLISLPASHAHNNADSLKLVTDRWVDRSVVMGKLQSEQYYSPDPAMIFSGVVACATDLSPGDLEVLSAGITALGGQWRTGLTRDVTHLFALRTGSDKYNTALHFASQTHMCILTPHWFDDAVRLGRRIQETPYAWPDPPVLRPGLVLYLDKDTGGGRRRKLAGDKQAETPDTANQGENVRVWAGRRILLSASLELSDGSRGAIEAGIQRAGGLVVSVAENAEEDEEETAVDGCDVLVTRWRSGKSYFKAARASLLIGTLSWLFSVESTGTLHSPLDSLLWYPTPRGGIPDLIGREISITNYTGAARDYLKRLITLIGAKFTPSMSQSNKVLVAGFQPSPKTTRALSWSIPVVNHTWLEDCIVEWHALTVGLERYIVYPPGIDFGKMLMARPDGVPSSQFAPPPRLNGGALPGGRGIGAIDVEQEIARDAKHRVREQNGEITMYEAYANDTTTDGPSMILDGGVLADPQTRPPSHAGSLKKTPTFTRKRASTSTSAGASAMGVFVDQVIELPSDDGEGNAGIGRGTTTNGKRRAPKSPHARSRSVSRASSVDEIEVVLRGPGAGSKNGKGKGTVKDAGRRRTDPSEPEPRLNDRAARTEDAVKVKKLAPAQSNKGRQAKGATAGSDSNQHSDAGESEVSVPPRRTTAKSKTPVKSGMKPRPRSKSRSRPSSVLGGDTEDEIRVISAMSGTETRKQPGKPKRSGEVEIQGKRKGQTKEIRKKGEEYPESSRPSARSPSPISPSPAKSSRVAERRLSVLVPSVPKDYFSSQNQGDVIGDESEGGLGRESRKKGAGVDVASGSKPRPKQLAPAASMMAFATEASASTSKRGKPSAKSSTTPVTSAKSKPQPKAKAKPKSSASKEASKTREEDMGESEKDDDVSMIVDTSIASANRGGLRRSAANKATARLKAVVMPDVISFEREQKQAKRRRSEGGELVVSPREEDEERDKRGGKRRKMINEREEDEEPEPEEVAVPSAKAKPKLVNGKGKMKVAIAIGSDEDMDGPPAKNKPSGPVEKNSTRGGGKQSVPIRVMTTGVGLTDDVIKRLTKLGVQMTTKPTDCTHLIAKGFVRTEKFLCAMSVSPWVLTEGWANGSAKANKLLDEKGHLLSDTVAEQKWEFKFTDAMTRAKGPEGGSSLFKQMTFYVTPKVSVDAKLLKSVVSAGGGQVQNSVTPTVRILKGKENRYVVSCLEDKAIWRPLAAEGFKVYSVELVLRGALKQEIEWERKECLVAG